MKLINDNLQRIIDLCKKYKVNHLYVFGSILTPRFNAESDIDLLVDFKIRDVRRRPAEDCTESCETMAGNTF